MENLINEYLNLSASDENDNESDSESDNFDNGESSDSFFKDKMVF